MTIAHERKPFLNKNVQTMILKDQKNITTQSFVYLIRKRITTTGQTVNYTQLNYRIILILC